MSLLRVRSAVAASLVALVMGAGLHAPPAAAARAEDPPATSDSTPIPLPPLITEEWNGTTGVSTLDERWRKAVADVAALTAEPEIRDAALAALATGDAATIRTFATVTKPAMDRDVAARKKKEAADNLAAVKKLAGTGGSYFNAEVQRVLAGTDSDRAAFLAYGAGIARARDEKVTADARERAATLRERVRLVAAAAPAESNVRRAAEAALAGDDAAITAFLGGGYLTAARADAAEREQYLKDLEARNKAAEELSELAQRSAKANQARARLLAAHGDGVRALQRAANAMAATANGARHSSRVLAGSGTVAQKASELQAANTEAGRQLGYADQAARDAAVAAGTATTAAEELVAAGLPYGSEWSLIAEGMSQAATAAVGATTTARHAIEATAAANNAQGAQAQAEAHAQQAIKWRAHAEAHARAAKMLAQAAATQAAAAKTAAERTKKARQEAEAAEAKAWDEAAKTRKQKEIAQAQAAEAKRQRQIADQERANAAAYRATAEQQASVARNARADADAQAAKAASARSRAFDAAATADAAEEKAWEHETDARTANLAAHDAERERQTAAAKAQATKSWEASADSAESKKEAQAAATEAAAEYGVADNAARSARGFANTAAGAAANSQAAAAQAQNAATRAWAAAERAAAAAAAADAAADKAEASAKATHAARLKADAKAAEATAQEINAARAADAAVRLAEQAADQAVRALWAADRTKSAAEAATTEAVAAAAQAEIAVSAATAARQSAAGIAAPADTAIGMVSPFTGSDIDADFVKLVAEQAKSIGAEQAAAAAKRADEAILAAQGAEAAAERANAQVKPAYAAAAQAARSAADAATSAAEAKKYAAQAAADGAAARAAAASAGKADAQARADAVAARQAASEAAGDAAAAGRSAQAAQADADAASSAAAAAERDAQAADEAANSAEADAAAAKGAADAAQASADSAAIAADKALDHAIEARKAAERTEIAERQREAAQRADNAPPTAGEEADALSFLTPQELEEYRKAAELSGEDIRDFLKREGLDFLVGLIVPEDLQECADSLNPGACFWMVVDLIPWTKIKKVGNVYSLYKKYTKWADDLQAARKKRRDLDDVAKKRKNPNAGCPDLPSPNSFLPGTTVLLADGSARAIEKIAIGDQVLASDPVTGVTTAKPVRATIAKTGDKQLVDVTVGGATITATGNHPFWVPALEVWLDAKDLSPQQWLRTSSGTLVQISAVRHHEAYTRVHNLTVADLHTYYVMAGDTPVLVHNDSEADFNQAMNKALAWLEERGFVAERKTIGKFGTIAGKPIGMQTANGKTGFRIEFDERNGAHINVWSGKEKGPHFNFNATEATVTKIQGRFGCGDGR